MSLYKMPQSKEDEEDWICRPDEQLDEEIRRMALGEQYVWSRLCAIR